MVDDAISKAQSMVVSSVYLRLISTDVTEKNAAVNGVLRVTSEVKGVTFADGTSSVIRLRLKNTKRALRHIPLNITNTFEES